MSSQEYRLPADTVILSTSDLHGNILSFNKGFLDASGYSASEIIGKPHSILRHPDMPKEAFKDLWDTIADGRPWFGLVKNKRKNGQHYWVSANASPIYTNGQISGYVSVRYPASDEQKAFAEGLYADIRQQPSKMPWTPKPKMDRWSLLGIGLGVISTAALVITTDALFQSIATLMSATGLTMIGWRNYILSRPNAIQAQAIKDLANGQFRTPIAGNDAWTNELNLLRTRVGQNASENFDAARESAVLTAAMNAASTCLMVADNNFKIVSINTSFAQLLTNNEADIKTRLPQFNVANIVGSDMTDFCQDPSAQESLFAELTQPWTGHLNIGRLRIENTVVPIMNQGQKLGYVIEWLDITAQCQVQDELSNTIHEASKGIISNRINTQGLSGFYLTAGQGVNSLLEGLHQFISKTIHSIGELAFNRLNGRLDGHYEGSYRMTQDAIHIALHGLNEMVGEVQFTANNVTEAMLQLSHGVGDFSSKIQQQTAAIEQTSAATTQMLNSLQQNTVTINATNDITHQVTEQVIEGSNVMKHALEAMQAVEASGQKIGSIVSLIDSIAFQTNLLALNAAVEAARAGEHGRGFAVVASEVRTLAGKSAEAAKDIKHLIDTSVQHITEGSRRVHEANRSLDTIKASVTEVNQMIGHVTEASIEQEKAVHEVSNAMTIMDSVSQQSASLIQQTVVRTEQVVNNMKELKQLTDGFTLSDNAQRISQQGRSALADIKQAHLNWRLRIINVLNGLETNINAKDAGNHQLCALGKWRSSTGRQYDHLPMMTALDSAHQHFHAIAAQAVEAAYAKDHHTIDMLLTNLNQQYLQIIQALDQLEEHINQENKPERAQKVTQARVRAALPATKTTKPPTISTESWSEF